MRGVKRRGGGCGFIGHGRPVVERVGVRVFPVAVEGVVRAGVEM